MKPVDVLGRIDRVEDLLRGALPHRGRQRRLDEDAVVCVARVQPLDQRQQLVERRVGRQPLQIDPQTGIGPGAHLVADVDLGRGIFADEHDAEAGGRPARAVNV